MQAEISTEANTPTLQAAAQELATTRRANLNALLCLVVLAAIFAFAAWSWVSFYKGSGGATGLFTQTDFPAVTIASRLVAEGRGASLYNLDAQLEGQRKLIAEGYIALSPADGLKYPYPYTPPIAVLM